MSGPNWLEAGPDRINEAGFVYEEDWLIEVGQRAHDHCDFCFFDCCGVAMCVDDEDNE
jgi:hypothetical protein